MCRRDEVILACVQMRQGLKGLVYLLTGPLYSNTEEIEELKFKNSTSEMVGYMVTENVIAMEMYTL